MQFLGIGCLVPRGTLAALPSLDHKSAKINNEKHWSQIRKQLCGDKHKILQVIKAKLEVN